MGRRLALLVAFTAAFFPGVGRGVRVEVFLNTNSITDLTFLDSVVACASTRGLQLYDPATDSFTRFFRSEGLPSLELTSVAVDAEGRLWAGTKDAGIAYPRAGLGSWGGVSFGLPSKAVNCLMSRADTIWVGTDHGLVVWDAKSNNVLRIYSTGSGLPSEVVETVSRGAGRLWCGTAGGLAYLGGGGSWVVDDPGAQGEPVFDVEARGESLLVSTRSGVYLREGGSWSDLGFSSDSARSVGFFENTIWVGTFGSGVFKLAGSTWEKVAGGFYSLLVTDLGVSGGRLWAATDRGLYSLEPDSPEWNWHYASSPTAADLRDVRVDGESGVWAVGRRKLSHFDGEVWDEWHYRNTSGGIHSSDLASVFPGEGQSIWLGHCCCLDTTSASCRTDLALEPVRQGPWRAYPMYNVISINRDPMGDLWFGSDGFGLYRFREADSTIARYESEISSDQIWAIEPVGLGQVWFGNAFQGVDILFRGGLSAEDPETWRHLASLDTLGSNYVTSLSYDGRNVWVGTLGGVFVFDSESRVLVKSFGVPEGLSAPGVNDVAAYRVGAAWVATGMGLDHLSLDGEHFSLTLADGVASLPVEALDVDPVGGVLWVACNEGLNRIGLEGSTASRASVFGYPNPKVFTGTGAGGVRLGGYAGVASGEVFTLEGRRVFSFHNVRSGEEFFWGLDEAGKELPSGLYLVRVRAEGTVQTFKLALVR